MRLEDYVEPTLWESLLAWVHSITLHDVLHQVLEVGLATVFVVGVYATMYVGSKFVLNLLSDHFD